jgi:hypothetical protein
MSIERSSTPTPAEAPLAPGLLSTATPGEITPAMRLQILSTEHWSLLATRSLAWNEVFSRAGMYLSLLSGAIVALALVGNGSEFGDAFFVFGVAILPVVLYVGVTTHLRLAAANFLDAQTVIGMNRIRAGYLSFAPDLEPYFVSGTHDDITGVSKTMAIPPGTAPVAHVLAATPALVNVVNAVVAAALVGFVILLARGPEAAAIIGAAIGFGATFVAGTAYGRARMRDLQASQHVMFPSPEG